MGEKASVTQYTKTEEEKHRGLVQHANHFSNIIGDVGPKPPVLLLSDAHHLQTRLDDAQPFQPINDSQPPGVNVQPLNRSGDDLQPLPPGVDDVDCLLLDTDCQLMDALGEHHKPALIGLEFVVEVLYGGGYVKYECLLCNIKKRRIRKKQIIHHTTTHQHRYNYIDKYLSKCFTPNY